MKRPNRPGRLSRQQLRACTTRSTRQQERLRARRAESEFRFGVPAESKPAIMESEGDQNRERAAA